MKVLLKDLLLDESGQGLIEYGLIIVIVAIALMGSLRLFKDELTLIYNEINGDLP